MSDTSCSFCGRKRENVEFLFTGAGGWNPANPSSDVSMCSVCVIRCHKMMVARWAIRKAQHTTDPHDAAVAP